MIYLLEFCNIVTWYTHYTNKNRILFKNVTLENALAFHFNLSSQEANITILFLMWVSEMLLRFCLLFYIYGIMSCQCGYEYLIKLFYSRKAIMLCTENGIWWSLVCDMTDIYIYIKRKCKWINIYLYGESDSLL